MATDEREKEWKVFQVTIGLVILMLLATFFVVPPRWVIAFHSRQQVLITRALGAGVENGMRVDTDRDFNRWFVVPGVVAESYSGLRGMESHVSAFWGVVWLGIERFKMVWLWLPLMIPVGFAAVTDGWVRRRIGQWRFEFISRARHHYARKGVHYFVLVGIFGPFFPLPLPPLVIPLLWFVGLGSLRTWVASLQKRY
ncbi:hypothetical protein BMS3Bbin13_00004 [bacterium BMS3Bbin13]|nr:hypothetical protein BMS3Bbin13_00004 [bacterium BMS3Bbin13]